MPILEHIDTIVTISKMCYLLTFTFLGVSKILQELKVEKKKKRNLSYGRENLNNLLENKEVKICYNFLALWIKI